MVEKEPPHCLMKLCTGQERNEFLLATGDMSDSKGAVTGILDVAVVGTTDKAETVCVRTGDKDLDGMVMVRDAVDGDILGKRDEFVGDLSDHNC